MIYSISKIIVLSAKFENISTNTKLLTFLFKGIILNHLLNLLSHDFNLFLGKFPYYRKFILITFSFPLLNFFVDM